jgi:hypothetical protein
MITLSSRTEEGLVAMLDTLKNLISHLEGFKIEDLS